MKKFALLLFATILFLTSVPVHAYNAFGPDGTASNPIYVKVVPNPLQELIDRGQQQTQSNSLVENQLKALYGSTSYYSCYSQSCRTGVDYTDPTMYSACLSLVRSCLERGAERKSVSQAMQCPNGSIYSVTAGSCVALTTPSTDSKKPVVFFSDPTQNAPKKTQTTTTERPDENQSCGQYFPGSAWMGEYNENGGPLCDCTAPLTWNGEKTACVRNIFTRNLKFGMHGDDVHLLQQVLLQKGLLVLPKGTTGYFGATTRQALVKYQKTNKLKATGIVDAATMALLNGEAQ